MIEIDLEKFERWISSRFPSVRVKGDEYCVDSIFTPDKKKHLWVNPSKNAFRCWKSDQRGTVISLVAKTDHCPIDEASKKVCLMKGDVRGFPQAIEALKKRVDTVQKEGKRRSALWPEGFLEFRSNKPSAIREKCLSYLESRKIDPDPFGIGYCIKDPYKCGILLPIFDCNGSLIYWTVRMLDGDERYKNPPRDLFGIYKEDIIWSGKKWPDAGGVVFLTEGIFNAMSLQLCGIPAISILGKEISKKQIEVLMVRRYSIVLALDNDEKGRKAESVINRTLSSAGIQVLGGVTSDSFKDWNQFLVEKDKKTLRSFIPLNMRQLDLPTSIKKLLSAI